MDIGASTACESCGSRRPFKKNAAGFFLCIDCGSQQSDVREEYRDEEDFEFERTGIRDFGARTGAAFIKTRTLASVTAGKGNKDSSEDEDYNDDVEAKLFDPEWPRKAPSENDFIRALQTILMHCVRDITLKLNFPPALESECRTAWLDVIKYYVEFDYPAQTYFCDTTSNRFKIGVRRLYTPKVLPADPYSVLKNPDLSIALKAVVRHMGLDRLSYIKSIAPYRKGNVYDRLDANPEIVTLKQGPIETGGRVKFDLPEVDGSDNQGRKRKQVPLDDSSRQVKKVRLDLNSSREVEQSTDESANSEETSSDDDSSSSKLSVDLKEELLNSQSSNQHEAVLDDVEPLFVDEKSNTLDVADSVNLPLRHTTSEAEVAVSSNDTLSQTEGYINPLETSTLTPGLKILPQIDPDCRASDKRPFFDVTAVPSLRPRRSMGERHRDACIEKGIEPRHLPYRPDRPGIFERPLPRYMRENPNNKYSKYKDGDTYPTPIGTSLNSISLMVKERMLSFGPRCTGSSNSRSVDKINMRPIVSASHYRTCPDTKWQVDGIYEHDFVSRFIATENLLRLKNVDPSGTQTDKTGICQTSESRAEDLSADGLSKILRTNLKVDDIVHLLQTDATIKRVHDAWTRKGLPFALHARKKKTQIERLSVRTNTDGHQSMLQNRRLRHEVSASGVLDRIFREVANTINPQACTALSATKDEENHCVSNLGSTSPLNSSNVNALPVARDEITEAQGLSSGSNLLPLVSTPTCAPPQSSCEIIPSLHSLIPSFLDSLNKELSDSAVAHSISESLSVLVNQEKKSDVVPMKRLDAFYYLDHFQSRVATTSVQRLVDLKRKNHSMQKICPPVDSNSFKIFNDLISNPSLTMGGTELLQNEEIFDRLAKIYYQRKDEANLKYLPILRFNLNRIAEQKVPSFRTVLIRELFSLIGSSEVTNSRLIDEENIYVPPRIDLALIFAIIWIGLLNTRHAITAVDVCRYVESGAISLHEAIDDLPVWLFEHGGLADSFSYCNTRRKLQHVLDRSVIQLNFHFKPYQLEKIAASLKRMGLRLSDFQIKAYVPRVIHHCQLPPYIQPLVNSMLDIMTFPLTHFQDGFKTIFECEDSIKKSLYGVVGPWVAPIAVIACVLIACRLLWPIFVYQPVGFPGIETDKEECGVRLYTRPEDEIFETEPLMRFDLKRCVWIVVINDDQKKEFDSKLLGFFESGLKALLWLQSNSREEFERLISQFKELNTETDSDYFDIPSIEDSKDDGPFDVPPLLIQYFKNGHRKYLLEMEKKYKEKDKRLFTTTDELMGLLPTNQEMFSNVIANASKPGWIDSHHPWLFINDAWESASEVEKQSMLAQLSVWIYRPTLFLGNFRVMATRMAAMSVIGPYRGNLPHVDEELSDFVDVFTNNDTETIEEPNEIPKYYISNVEDFFGIIYKLYLDSISSAFQEGPRPTGCIHPVDSTTTASRDAPLEDYRVPIPLTLLLRRLASFVGVEHLELYDVMTQIERWLFVAEVPERFHKLEKKRTKFKQTTKHIDQNESTTIHTGSNPLSTCVI